MLRRLALVVTGIFALMGSLAASAADIAGTWNLTVTTQAGTGTPTLVLVQNGETLTGTYTGRFGTSPIKGTYKDGTIVFSFEVSGPMGSTQVSYTGKVEGDSMSGSMQMGSMAGGTFSGKKAP